MNVVHVFVELLHSTAVQNMGNYQEYVKRLPPPMREIETQPARQHTFGNPFKVNKVNAGAYLAGGRGFSLTAMTGVGEVS